MPLLRGRSRSVANISELMHRGRPQPQAVAIALDIAGFRCRRLGRAGRADEAVGSRPHGSSRRRPRRDAALLGFAGASGIAAGASVDRLIHFRPMGIAPSRYALAGTLASALVAHHFDKHAWAEALATASVGVGVGIIGEAIHRGRGGRT